mgnify:CR=1 FL=1
MSFSKFDLDLIKSKIKLSSEINAKTKVIKKGKDYWCCCPFHQEKTPSCKINDDLCSFYCFGCGAKGDIFTIYTDLYNYSFQDAVKELGQKVGVKITDNNSELNKKNQEILKILELTTSWFENNLEEDDICKNYLKKRLLSNNTIKSFRIGYSYNKKKSLYNYLKDNGYKDDDIIESNVVKIDKNKKIKDFFYKRLIFPISNEGGKIVGFGGRVLDNSNPKYINSPESKFFKKRNLLYNLHHAKNNIRKKNNMLICEGYMDVIALFENNIKTAVAPLGTSFTEEQLMLSWKYVNKPTIMFDGDKSGNKAAYKAAIMALPFLNPNKYIQFIGLPENYDPDSFIAKNSLEKFITILKKPISITNFIFEQSSSTIDLNTADNKITYDKYIDDILDTIKDKKIKYFYRNEFKNLFFKKIKQNINTKKNKSDLPQISSLMSKQILSFFAAALNHENIREDILNEIVKIDILNENELNLLKFLKKYEIINKKPKELVSSAISGELSSSLKKCLENPILELFPYAKKHHKSSLTLEEIKDSIKNINTRLLNLKKINKSLDKFGENSNSISWKDLQEISKELHSL